MLSNLAWTTNKPPVSEATEIWGLLIDLEVCTVVTVQTQQVVSSSPKESGGNRTRESSDFEMWKCAKLPKTQETDYETQAFQIIVGFIWRKFILYLLAYLQYVVLENTLE